MSTRFSVEAAFKVVDRMTRPVRRMQNTIGRFTRDVRSGFRDLGAWGTRLRHGITAVGFAIAGAMALAAQELRKVISLGMDFDSTMARAAARFGVATDSAEGRALEEAALALGRNTEFMASQGAEALAELGATGLTAAQSIAQLTAIANTATSAGIELGEASEWVTDQMSAFGLVSDDLGEVTRNAQRVSDVMALGANMAGHTFGQLNEALTNVAAGAASAGLPIEDVTAALASLAGAGEKGARAGTRLDAMLRDLRTPSAQARRALRGLGVEVRNADGTLRPITDIVRQFEGALDGMNDGARDRALSRIFTDQGLRPMQLLLQQGSEKLDGFRSRLDNANGAAEAFANQVRDNAAGDLASFGSALEGLRLQTWSLVRGPFREMVQASTEWLRANQGVIASGLRGFVEFLTANMPTIEVWARRIGIAVAIVGTLLLLTMAAFVAVIVAIPALIVGVVSLLVAAWEWVADAASSAAAWIGEAFGGVWNAVRDFFGAALEFVVGVFVLLRRQAMTLLRPVIDWLASAGAWIAERWRPIGAFFGGLWAGIASAFSGAWDGLVKQAVAIYSRFLAIWRPLRGFFASLWSGIAQLFHGTLGGVLDQVGRVVENVRGVGRAELDGDAPPPSVVSPEARVARSISESTSTERAEVVIRPEGARAEVTRRPRGNGVALRVPASGGV